MTIKTPRKLIEVALPLDDINEACAREKSIRHGHPQTLHLWWARRPLAAARAVIFAQLVNDPGYERGLGRGMNKEKAKVERERLFGIIRKLVEWENTNNKGVIDEARAEIRKSWQETCELNRNHPRASELFNPDELPAFHDPFAGGGALPLEAQRLGLQSHASDLNPVAVLINKSMIEIPPRFLAHHPIGPIPAIETQGVFSQEWQGASGLAEDVRRYGVWMRAEAHKRIGHFYPKVALSKEQGGGEATVIAWLWARTVKSPNPVYSHVDVPLASTFVLSSKIGKEAYIEPVIIGDTYHFEIRKGKAPEHAKTGTKLARGANFKCLISNSPIEPKYIYSEANAGRMGARLMAAVVSIPRGRLYVPATPEMELLASRTPACWKPDVAMPENPRWFSPPLYGLKCYGDLFTPRQLLALNTFSDMVQEARALATADAIKAGLENDGKPLNEGGKGATAYGDAIAVYLAFLVDQQSNQSSTICGWNNINQQMIVTFSRQAIAMVWDYAECNVFSSSTGSFNNLLERQVKGINSLSPTGEGFAFQCDAQNQTISKNKVISTDPPYYDNIGYADLSDFFYVWLRRALKPVYPELFSTMAVPKAEELVATPYRHGGKDKAETFFLEGMTEAMRQLADQGHPAFPVTIYYAFKQSDTTDLGTGNTGWETFLEALIKSGFVLAGTWPVRTESANKLKAGVNALASSIVLVCRHRDPNAISISRRDFIRELKEELAEAIEVMIGGSEGVSPVAPVDLAQAVIGPGMAIFSKYSAVLEADGSPMTVHSALVVINKMLTEGGDDFDGDTQFCLGWFDQLGWTAGEFGQADVLARAKGTSVDGVREAGVVEAGAGRVRLLKPAEYPADWAPENDNRTPVWEALHQLIRALQTQGEAAAGVLLARMPQRAEPIRNLAYRLYTLCERKGWVDEARSYNELITSWLGIEAASHEAGHLGSQAKLDI